MAGASASAPLTVHTPRTSCSRSDVCRELAGAKGFERFAALDCENPFKRNAKKGSPKYRHVASPIRDYIKTKCLVYRSPAKRAAILASGHTKV